ncbi:MAG TPA: LysR substrate-binding domain-containing protein [Polyangiaceae bacterium]|nr:LysR substrate-binding domain-containing protein [Polyangiaceae bacterium]
MEHKLLKSFVAVAEELHFGRAARRLHLSQPPLSLQIQKLEAELGTALFVRSNRHVALTEAGHVLLGRARHLLAESDRAAQEVSRVGRGELGAVTLGYTATASHRLLPELVPRFRKLHPGLRLELLELRSAEQPEAIAAGRIELGLVCAPVPAPGLTETPLLRERLLVALPKAHPLAKKSRLHPRDLDGADYVGVRPDIEPAWAEASLRALKLAGAVPRLVQETDTKIALLGLVAAGLGLSVVSESLAVLERRGVVFRSLPGLKLELTLSALTRAVPTPRAASLLELMRRVFTAPGFAPSLASRHARR